MVADTRGRDASLSPRKVRTIAAADADDTRAERVATGAEAGGRLVVVGLCGCRGTDADFSGAARAWVDAARPCAGFADGVRDAGARSALIRRACCRDLGLRRPPPRVRQREINKIPSAATAKTTRIHQNMCGNEHPFQTDANVTACPLFR